MSARPDAPPTRALAWLYSPAPLREPLAALCALEREISASVRPGLDHHVAHTRLSWWREECARCAAGHPSHPLTRSLAAAFAPDPGAALANLGGLVDGAVWDLAAATFQTRRELAAYCARWSAAMIEPLGRLGPPDTPGAPLQALGRDLRELELLLALPRDARAGRVRLPLDELEQAGAAAEELAQPPWRAALAQLVRTRHGQLRGALAASVAALGAHSQATLRGLVVWAALAAHASRRAQARLPQATLSREHQTPLDGWRAWRAARRALTGRGLQRRD
jgi:15-cis-phytoene synthase